MGHGGPYPCFRSDTPWTFYILYSLTEDLEGVRDGEGLLHEEYLAGVVAGVLRPNARHLQVVPRHQLEPGWINDLNCESLLALGAIHT